MTYGKSDLSGNARRLGLFGGHLEPDTTVFTFAVVTLGVLDDAVDLSAVDNEDYR